MGLEAVIRTLLEELCPMAFQQAAQVQAHGDITVAVRDTNMPIRGAPLCYDAAGLFTSKGLTSWAALCHHIWTPLQGLYDGGIDTVVEQLDGRCPRAKEWVQHKRKTTAESSKKREQKKDDAIKKEEDGDVVIKEEAEGEEEDSEPLVSRFKWPEQDDGLPWFQLDQRPQCGINDIYYHKVAKRKWYQFLCHWLLYESPLPRGKTLIVDCAELADHDCVHPLRATVRGDGTRVVDVMRDDHPIPYWTADDEGKRTTHGYQEADDLISRWVYYWAARGRGVVVLTGDGDITVSLMMTYRTRVEVLGADKPRLLLRRNKRLGTMVNGSVKSEPQLVDIDMLSSHLEMLLGGLMAQGVESDGSGMTALRHSDGVLLFALLALMRKNDYSSALPQLSLINIVRGARNHPELARQVMRVTPPARFAPLDIHASSTSQVVEYMSRPRQVLLHGARFRDLVSACYEEAWTKRSRTDKNGKVTQRADRSLKQAPLPSNEALMGKCARVAWTLDKMLNGCRAGYVCADELACTTEGPVYGYVEAPAPDGSGKMLVAEAGKAAPAEWYGVVQH